MKKFGFTLAEVLIALSLIGIVSALALPSLMRASQHASIGAQLSKTQNAIEEAASRLVLEYADIPFKDIEGFETKLADHLMMKSTSGGYKLKDGVVISFSSGGSGTIPSGAGSAFREVTVDVNGAGSPNSSGIDIFKFTLTDQGLIFPQGCAQIIQENNWKLPKDYNCSD